MINFWTINFYFSQLQESFCVEIFFQLLLFYVPCQQGVVVYKLLISFQFFFANPSKPTFDAQFCQFMYVISKPKKPGTGTPAGKQIANFVRTCGRADVRTPDTPASGFARRSLAAAGHASRRPPCHHLIYFQKKLIPFFLSPWDVRKLIQTSTDTMLLH